MAGRLHDGRTFNPLEIDSIRPRADRMFKACVCEALIAGETQNADGLGTNLDFTGNNSGWTQTGDGEFKYGNNVQKYGKAPLTKSIKNSPVCPKALIQFPYRLTTAREPMPTSRLRITPQTPKKMSFLIFSGTKQKKKLHHLYEHHYASKEELANNAVQISGTGTELDGQWIPDGVAGGEAAFAFNDRTDYTTTITCYVGEDGKLRFGISMPTGPNADNWTLFDNFHIQYLGAADMTGAVSALNAKIAEANAALADKAITTEEAYNALSQAIQDAEKALEGELTEEIYTAQIESLDEAITLNRNSVEKVEALHKTASCMTNKSTAEHLPIMTKAYWPDVVYKVWMSSAKTGSSKTSHRPNNISAT